MPQSLVTRIPGSAYLMLYVRVPVHLPCPAAPTQIRSFPRPLTLTPESTHPLCPRSTPDTPPGLPVAPFLLPQPCAAMPQARG